MVAIKILKCAKIRFLKLAGRRFQLIFGSLEELIAPDDPVRFLDAFTEKMDLLKLGFQVMDVQTEGRPSFQ